MELDAPDHLRRVGAPVVPGRVEGQGPRVDEPSTGVGEAGPLLALLADTPGRVADRLVQSLKCRGRAPAGSLARPVGALGNHERRFRVAAPAPRRPSLRRRSRRPAPCPPRPDGSPSPAEGPPADGARPGRRASLPGRCGTNGESARGFERSPPPARRSASDRSDFLGFDRSGPGASRKMIGTFSSSVFSGGGRPRAVPCGGRAWARASRGSGRREGCGRRARGGWRARPERPARPCARRRARTRERRSRRAHGRPDAAAARRHRATPADRRRTGSRPAHPAAPGWTSDRSSEAEERRAWPRVPARSASDRREVRGPDAAQAEDRRVGRRFVGPGGEGPHERSGPESLESQKRARRGLPRRMRRRPKGSGLDSAQTEQRLARRLADVAGDPVRHAKRGMLDSPETQNGLGRRLPVIVFFLLEIEHAVLGRTDFRPHSLTLPRSTRFRPEPLFRTWGDETPLPPAFAAPPGGASLLKACPF